MPIDLVLLGPKLKGYREQMQLDVREISSRTGISEERLLAYEGGGAVPSGDEMQFSRYSAPRTRTGDSTIFRWKLTTSDELNCSGGGGT